MSSQPIFQNTPDVLNLSNAITWGKNVVFGPNCRSVEIGFGSFIGNDVYIDVEHLTIGDYFTVHHGSVLHGEKIEIGHNTWVGHYSILDGLGGLLRLGNNIGVGAHSQLWTHMKFGDVLDGCQWNTKGKLLIGDDAWIVGHGIVSPIEMGSRAMLLAGSVATSDIPAGRTFAGTPAKDITAKFGAQFGKTPSKESRLRNFEELLRAFEKTCCDAGFVEVSEVSLFEYSDSKTFFDLEARVYQPRYTEEERALMKFLLYEKAKFVPYQSGREIGQTKSD